MLPIPGEFTFPILWWVAVSFISSWGMVLMLMHVFCLSLNALSSLPRPLTCQVLLNLFCSSGFVFTEEFWHGLCFSCPGAVCKCWRRGWKSKGVCFVMLAAAFQGCLLRGAGRVQLSSELSALLGVEITAWLSELPKVARFPKWLFCLAEDLFQDLSSRGLCNFVNPKRVWYFKALSDWAQAELERAHKCTPS